MEAESTTEIHTNGQNFDQLSPREQTQAMLLLALDADVGVLPRAIRDGAFGEQDDSSYKQAKESLHYGATGESTTPSERSKQLKAMVDSLTHLAQETTKVTQEEEERKITTPRAEQARAILTTINQHVVRSDDGSGSTIYEIRNFADLAEEAGNRLMNTERQRLEEKKTRNEDLTENETRELRLLELADVARGEAGILLRVRALEELKRTNGGADSQREITQVLEELAAHVGTAQEAVRTALATAGMKGKDIEEMQRLLENGDMKGALELATAKKADTIASIVFGEALDKSKLDVLIAQLPDRQRELFMGYLSTGSSDNFSSFLLMLAFGLGREVFSLALQDTR